MKSSIVERSCVKMKNTKKIRLSPITETNTLCLFKTCFETLYLCSSVAVPLCTFIIIIKNLFLIFSGFNLSQILSSALMFIFLLFVLNYVFRLVIRLYPRHRHKSICSFYLRYVILSIFDQNKNILFDPNEIKKCDENAIWTL